MLKCLLTIKPYKIINNKHNNHKQTILSQHITVDHNCHFTMDHNCNFTMDHNCHLSLWITTVTYHYGSQLSLFTKHHFLSVFLHD